MGQSSSNEARLDTHREGGVFVVKLRASRLVGPTADKLRGFLKQHADEEYTSMVLDLSEVRLIDSYGLGSLITGLKVHQDRKEFYLAGVTHPVLDLLKLTRLDRVFQLVDNWRDVVNTTED
jgi:anti-anti-sigma factor